MCFICKFAIWSACLCGCCGTCMHSCSPRHTSQAGSAVHFIQLPVSDDDDDGPVTGQAGEGATDVDPGAPRDNEEEDAELEAAHLAYLLGIEPDQIVGRQGDSATDRLVSVRAKQQSRPEEASASAAFAECQPGQSQIVPTLSGEQMFALIQMNKADPLTGRCLHCLDPPDEDTCTETKEPVTVVLSNWAVAYDHLFGSLCGCDPFMFPRHLRCIHSEIVGMTPLSSRKCLVCGKRNRAFAYPGPEDRSADAPEAAPIQWLVFPSNMSAIVAEALGLQDNFRVVADRPQLQEPFGSFYCDAWHGFKAGAFSVYCWPPDGQKRFAHPPPDLYNVVYYLVTLYGQPVKIALLDKTKFPSLTNMNKPSGRQWKRVQAKTEDDGIGFATWPTIMQLRRGLIEMTHA